MAIIKVDSRFFKNLSTYLGKLSEICTESARELHTKNDNSLDFNEKVMWCVDTQGYLGEAKAYLNAKEELDKLVEELVEKFTMTTEEGS